MRTALALLFSSAACFAQLAPTARSDVQKQILAIEEEIGRANSTCNYDYFRKIEADEFIFTDSQGNLTTRAEDLAGERDCKPNQDTFALEEPRLPLCGNVAVSSARATVKGQRNGRDFTRQNRFTDVFVWRGGRWQLVSGHSSRIPPKSGT